MKKLAYSPILYGSEYLEKAIKSVSDVVDEHLILYTNRPSYGHAGNLSNPDSKQDILNICNKFNHVIFHEVNVNGEGNHRKLAFNYANQNNYDIVLAVDYDEIWDTNMARKAINMAYEGNSYQYGVAGTQWVTFWKSLNEYVTDGFYPIRLFNLRNKIGTQEILHDNNIWIYHMGYCISDELMEYKLSCHGHKSEIPRDWINNKWYGYQKGVTKYLHPATDAYWIEAKDRDFELPNILKLD